MRTTDQVAKKAPNPSGKGGFGDNPENRNPGGWKKENTARYKLELLIQMSDHELATLIDDPTTPRFDKNMAIAVQKGEWREIDSMINQVYGKPKESIDLSNPDGSLTPIVRIIDSRISPDE